VTRSGDPPDLVIHRIWWSTGSGDPGSPDLARSGHFRGAKNDPFLSTFWVQIWTPSGWGFGGKWALFGMKVSRMCSKRGQKVIRNWSKSGSFWGTPKKLSYNRRSTFFTKNHFFAFFRLFFSLAVLGRGAQIRTPFLTPFLAFFDIQKRGHFSPDKWGKNDVIKSGVFHFFIFAEKKWSKNWHFKSDQKVWKSALYTPIHPEGLDPFRDPLFDPKCVGNRHETRSKRGQKRPFLGSFWTPFLTTFWALFEWYLRYWVKVSLSRVKGIRYW